MRYNACMSPDIVGQAPLTVLPARFFCGPGPRILLSWCEGSQAAVTERPARGMSDFFVTSGFICTVAARWKAVHSDTG